MVINMSIHKMFIYGTFMIVATILFRFLLKDRIPRFTYVLMWYIAAIRITVPFEIKFPLSIYSTGDYNNSLNYKIIPSLVSSRNAISIVPANNTFENGFNMLKTIWLIGIVIVLIYFILVYIIFIRKTASSIPSNFSINIAGAKKLRRSIKILECPEVDSPLTYGIFFPKIILPKYESEYANTLKYILLHEYIHIKRFDSIGKMLLVIALAFNWFNPLVWIMFILANQDIEISCDESVLNITGSNKEYAMSLINSEEKRLSKLSQIYIGFSKNIVEERVCHIMKFKKKSKFSIVLAAASIIVLASAFTTSPADKDYYKSSESFETSENNSDIAFIWPAQDCYIVTAEYIESGSKIHQEIDISGENACGKKVYAAAGGKIESIEYSFENGNTITVDHGNSIKTIYSHCKEIFVSQGENVTQGCAIATIGNTGASTGAHLGFSVIENNKYIDPLSLFD